MKLAHSDQWSSICQHSWPLLTHTFGPGGLGAISEVGHAGHVSTHFFISSLVLHALVIHFKATQEAETLWALIFWQTYKEYKKKTFLTKADFHAIFLLFTASVQSWSLDQPLVNGVFSILSPHPHTTSQTSDEQHCSQDPVTDHLRKTKIPYFD